MSATNLFEAIALHGVADGPHVLVLAGVHGDECEPMVACRRLARRIKGKLLRGSVTVVPILNISARRRKTRVGEDGLDLARTFPGRIDGSITERVAHAATELISSADYLIDLHTGGKRLQLWPLAGFMLHPQPQILEQQRMLARAFNLPVVWGTDPAPQGRTLSAARDANVPAIYVEYLGSASFNRTAVRALTEGCLNVLASLSMIDLPAPPNRVRYWAEDPRPGAGHLQASHPAPHAGLFEPAVELGELVRAGQNLGWVATSTGREKTAIIAGQAGRVVCLSAPLAVQSGDGVAVVVEFQTV